MRPPYPMLAEFWRDLSVLQYDPLSYFRALQIRYGDVARWRMMGTNDLVFVFNPDGIEHVLQEKSTWYRRGPFNRKFRLIEGDGLFVNEGESWLASRRLAQPLFHAQRLARLSHKISEATQKLCATLTAQAEEEPCFDPTSLFFQHQLCIAGRMIFGFDWDDERENGKLHELARSIETARDHVGYCMRNALAPAAWIPTSRNRRFLKARACIEAFIQELLKERRASLLSTRSELHNGSHCSEENDDLLSIFLTARDEDDRAMTAKQIRDELITMLIVGHEPTVAGMTWALSLLAHNPTAQEKMRSEVHNIPGNNTIELEALESLPYTCAVVDETLRLYPPVWSQSRQAVVDDQICGFDIKRGSHILLMQAVVHRHPKLWDNPDAFQPERFLKSTNSNPSRHKFAYFPFGGGQRMCMGARLALLVMRLTLAAVVQKFHIEPATLEIPKAMTGVTLRPAPGDAIRLSKVIESF